MKQFFIGLLVALSLISCSRNPGLRQVVNVHFTEKNLYEAAAAISELSGIKIEISDQVDVSKLQLISLNIEEVELKDVLEFVGLYVDLEFEISGNSVLYLPIDNSVYAKRYPIQHLNRKYTHLEIEKILMEIIAGKWEQYNHSIFAKDGYLYVSNTKYVHRYVEELLNTLNKNEIMINK